MSTPASFRYASIPTAPQVYDELLIPGSGNRVEQPPRAKRKDLVIPRRQALWLYPEASIYIYIFVGEAAALQTQPRKQRRVFKRELQARSHSLRC